MRQRRLLPLTRLEPKNVALACERIDATNVYISTDYIFDGTKSKPYVESDLPNPINTYGLSKYAGEIFTRNYSSKYYIVRVASLFGVTGARGKGGNFVETMIQKAKSGGEIKVVDDIIISPTYTRDAAIAIKEIIGKKLHYGIYHATNSGACSWYEFACAILDFINFDIVIKPVKSRAMNLVAPRPKNSSLESKKLEKYGIRLKNWRSALKDYLKEKRYI